MTSERRIASAADFVLFPAIAMLLGWGLRGYIGGGPFAAMIPGAFVAMSLSLMLGHSPAFAAVVACFGAIGIGYGGEMTYGQTLGLAREAETRAWGLLGVTVKGGVWGLLGGAVMGAGLTHRQYDRRRLALAFPLMIAAAYIGFKLVNEPKLIYFSDPVNKPRQESWAALLFGAVAFLAYVTRIGRGAQAGVPLKFALIGAVGGAIGFGGGTLWLVYGDRIPVEQKWWGWWKMMEFSFGLALGAALGLAAWLERERISELGAEPGAEAGPPAPDAGWMPVAGVAALVVFFFAALPYVLGLGGEDSEPGWLAKNLGAIFYSFVFLGGVCAIAGLWSRQAAWQVAITLTFFHTMLDLNEDMFSADRGYAAPNGTSPAVLLGSVALVGWAAERLSRGPRAVRNLFLLLLWTCFAVATARSFLFRTTLFPEGGVGYIEGLLRDQASMLVTHAIFTLSALATAAFIMKFGAPARAESPR